MKTTRIEGVLTALSPIHHGGDEKTGSEVMIRRMKYMVSGKPEMIPVISGNAIRGPLRRKIMTDLCNRLDYKPTKKMYHSLFSGGVLEEVGSGAGKVNLDLRKKIRTYITALDLLGASILNQIVSGKLQVGIATPICRELNPYHSAVNQCENSYYDFLDDTFQTRKDDLKDRNDDEAAVQMLVTFETIAPGTQFAHSFTLLDHDDLLASCFHYMLELWSQDPHIGGRSSTGFGQVKLEYTIPEEFPESNLYLDFIKINRDDILATIKEIELLLG